MANLPNNSTYNINTSSINIPKASNVFSDPAKQADFDKYKKMVSDFDPSKPAQDGGAFLSRLDYPNLITPSQYSYQPTNYRPTVPTGTAFTDPTAEINRAQPFGETGYDSTFAFGKSPSETSVMRTTPNMGQYIQDSADPEVIYRSERMDMDSWSDIRNSMLEGRNSSIYEVDHIIPLWLGGTNNKENLQVLTRDKHSDKIKAEAVALTLFSNDEIGRDEAMKVTMGWDNRDLTDFPPISKNASMDSGQTSGQMALTDAKAVYEKWNQQEGVAQKVSMFDNFFDKDKAISRGKYIDEKTEKLPSFIQGAVKGLVEGASFRSVQFDEAANNKGGMETFGRILGNVGGALLPIGAMSRVFGLASGATKAAGAVKGGLQAKGILKGASIGEVASSATAKTALGAKTLNPFSKGYVDAKMQGLIKAHADNFIKWTPPVVAYGQIATTFEDDPERGARLFEDIMYGGVTGFMSPTLVGSAKVAAFTGLSTIMLDTYSENREASWESALTNGLMMGVLHGVSAPGVKRQAGEETEKIIKEQIKQNSSSGELEQRTVDMATDIISMYVPRLEGSKGKSFTREEVDEIATEVATNFRKNIDKLPDEEFDRQNRAISAAIQSLYLSSSADKMLPKEVSTILQGFSDRANDPKLRDADFGGARPAKLTQIWDSIKDDLTRKSINPSEVGAALEFPGGRIRTTGLVGENIDPTDFAKFAERSKSGRVDPVLVGISRPERAPLFQKLSADTDINFTDSNSQYSVQVFAKSYANNGEIEYLNLGYLPQETRIDSNKFAINKQKEIVEGKYEGYDPALNKDTIGEVMEKEGLDYILLNLKSGDYSSTSKRPYVEAELNDALWRASKQAQTGTGSMAPKVSIDGSEAVLKTLNKTPNQKLADATKADYITNYNSPAARALDNIGADLSNTETGAVREAKRYLAYGEEILSQPSIDTMLNKMEEHFGFRLKGEEARKFFENRMNMKVFDYFNTVYNNVQPIHKQALGDIIFKPLRRITEEGNWEMAKVFRDLKVLGKDAAKPEPKISEAIKVKETPVAPKEKEVVSTQKAEEVNKVIATTPQEISIGTSIIQTVKEIAPEIVRPVKATKAATETTSAGNISNKVSNMAEILVPESTKAVTTRQGQVVEAIEATVEEAQRKMLLVKRTEYLGDAGFLKQLQTLAQNFDVQGARVMKPGEKKGWVQDKGTEKWSKDTVPAYGGVTPEERAVVNSLAGSRIANIGKDIYEKGIDTGFEYATNLKKGDDLFEPGKRVYDAMMLEKFNKQAGNRELDELEKSLGEELFDKAYRLMKQGERPAKPDFKKDFGKQSSKYKETGLTGGLLGDEQFKEPVSRGAKVISDLVDNPKAKAGTYISVFGEVLDKSMTKALGKEWKSNERIQSLLSDIDEPGSVNLWDSLLIRSEADTTQPLERIRAMSKGHVAKAKRLDVDRREEIWKSQNERWDRLASKKPARDREEGFDPEGNAPEGTRFADEAQLEEDNVLAPSAMDSIMAGLTLSEREGYTPTPEEAMADAIQFVFAINKAQDIKFNTKLANEVIDEVTTGLANTGKRLSREANPYGEAVSRHKEAVEVQSTANDLFKGDLVDRYNSLMKVTSPSGVPYSQWGSVKSATNPLAKLKALGIATGENLKDVDLGKVSKKGNPLRTTKEERLFNESFKKWQALITEGEELTQSKEVMKADASAKDIQARFKSLQKTNE